MSAPQATAVAEGIRERYWRRTARSREQGERAQRYLPAGHTRGSTQYSPYTTFLRAGQGCHIQDSDGNDYLDLLNNQTALIHGHGAPGHCRSRLRTICPRLGPWRAHGAFAHAGGDHL